MGRLGSIGVGKTQYSTMFLTASRIASSISMDMLGFPSKPEPPSGMFRYWAFATNFPWNARSQSHLSKKEGLSEGVPVSFNPKAIRSSSDVKIRLPVENSPVSSDWLTYQSTVHLLSLFRRITRLPALLSRMSRFGEHPSLTRTLVPWWWNQSGHTEVLMDKSPKVRGY